MALISEALLRFDGTGRACVSQADELTEREEEFHVADEKIANVFQRPVSAVLADLVDVAMAVYLADRVVRRRPAGLDRYELGWKRRLSLEVPVRLLERWRNPKVQEALRSSLEFFTDDDWSFIFLPRNRRRRNSERQQFLFPSSLTSPVQVALFSGGLDSLAGVAADLSDLSGGSLVLISGSTNPRLGKVLETLAADIHQAASRDVRALILPLGLRQPKERYNSNERSQRTRGFLYGTLAAVAAAMAGSHKVTLYENGIGAINLPYSPVQFGAHSTRSMNPVGVTLLSGFLELVLERPMKLQLPNLFATKGEMCAKLGDTPLRAAITTSITCDKFPLRSRKAAECGLCTSCLLRRQALWAAGLKDEDAKDVYSFDVIAEPNGVPQEGWDVLRIMLGQVDTFRRALASPRPWDLLAGEFPMLRNVAWTLEDTGLCSGPLEAQRELMSLLDRYCAEWEHFPVLPPGWKFGSSDHTTDWRFRHAHRPPGNVRPPGSRRSAA
jgi:hypothetical protein